MQSGPEVVEGKRGVLPATARLLAEFLLFFLVLPTLLIVFRHHVYGLVIPLILLSGLFSWLWLRRRKDFDRRRLWTGHSFRRCLLRRALVFLPLAAVAAVFSRLYMPESFLDFPRLAPVMWAIVMILYPVLSAYPQELFFRAFFFERYRPLFAHDWQLILASAVAFGWAHAFLGNWVAPVFAALGGIIFGRTYLRSGSLLLAGLEHGIWGDLLFTLGTGWLFYAGSIR